MDMKNYKNTLFYLRCNWWFHCINWIISKGKKLEVSEVIVTLKAEMVLGVIL
jgi:hypothetical protein